MVHDHRAIISKRFPIVGRALHYIHEPSAEPKTSIIWNCNKYATHVFITHITPNQLAKQTINQIRNINKNHIHSIAFYLLILFDAWAQQKRAEPYSGRMPNGMLVGGRGVGQRAPESMSNVNELKSNIKNNAQEKNKREYKNKTKQQKRADILWIV